MLPATHFATLFKISGKMVFFKAFLLDFISFEIGVDGAKRPRSTLGLSAS